MKSENLPKIEAEQYDPNLDAQDEDVLSGGNNRLTYILVGLIVALVIGYVALPKGNGSGLASVTPTFMLDDAAVTAAVPAADATGDAKEDETKNDDEEHSTKPAKKNVTTAALAQSATGVAAVAAEPVTAATSEAAEPAPVAAPAAAPESAAPTNVTMTGKIEDENGHPLVGATVLLKGSSKGTSTDANGNYALEVPAGTDNTLIYGYGGYDDEVMRTRGSQPVNVTLTPRAKASKHRH